jgi:VWFA-related protein
LLIGAQIAAARQFSSGISVVEVYATVAEDGVVQPIGAFAAGSFPLSIAIGLDRSFSMSRQRVDEAATAARRFVSALETDDQVMVLAIGSDVEVLAPLAADRRAAATALDGIAPWGTTPLYDAIAMAIDAIQAASGRRALVLLSDGRDRYSNATAADVLEEARRKDVLVYPVATEARRPPLFAELAAATGGRSFHARNARELETALTTIGRELREQYLIGYTPARPPDEEPRWRSITVTVRRTGLRVRARDGYYSR